MKIVKRYYLHVYSHFLEDIAKQALYISSILSSTDPGHITNKGVLGRPSSRAARPPADTTSLDAAPTRDNQAFRDGTELELSNKFRDIQKIMGKAPTFKEEEALPMASSE